MEHPCIKMLVATKVGLQGCSVSPKARAPGLLVWAVLMKAYFYILGDM